MTTRRDRDDAPSRDYPSLLRDAEKKIAEQKARIDELEGVLARHGIRVGRTLAGCPLDPAPPRSETRMMQLSQQQAP